MGVHRCLRDCKAQEEDLSGTRVGEDAAGSSIDW